MPPLIAEASITTDVDHCTGHLLKTSLQKHGCSRIHHQYSEQNQRAGRRPSPVSAFADRTDGTWQQAQPLMRSAVSRLSFLNGILRICIQCNKCSYVCPHAYIRPFVLTPRGVAAYLLRRRHSIPRHRQTFTGMRFVQQVDVLDCLGWGNCADVCSGKKGERR